MFNFDVWSYYQSQYNLYNDYDTSKWTFSVNLLWSTNALKLIYIYSFQQFGIIWSRYGSHELTSVLYTSMIKRTHKKNLIQSCWNLIMNKFYNYLYQVFKSLWNFHIIVANISIWQWECDQELIMYCIIATGTHSLNPIDGVIHCH